MVYHFVIECKEHCHLPQPPIGWSDWQRGRADAPPKGSSVRYAMAHILVVEDTHDNREVAELILRDAGHTVVSAQDGVSGVAAATTDHPDLILMDLSLPGVDGWSTTRDFKSDPDLKAIPIIALTAHVMMGSRILVSLSTVYSMSRS